MQSTPKKTHIALYAPYNDIPQHVMILPDNVFYNKITDTYSNEMFIEGQIVWLEHDYTIVAVIAVKYATFQNTLPRGHPLRISSNRKDPLSIIGALFNYDDIVKSEDTKLGEYGFSSDQHLQALVAPEIFEKLDLRHKPIEVPNKPIEFKPSIVRFYHYRQMYDIKKIELLALDANTINDKSMMKNFLIKNKFYPLLLNDIIHMPLRNNEQGVTISRFKIVSLEDTNNGKVLGGIPSNDVEIELEIKNDTVYTAPLAPNVHLAIHLQKSPVDYLFSEKDQHFFESIERHHIENSLHKKINVETKYFLQDESTIWNLKETNYYIETDDIKCTKHKVLASCKALGLYPFILEFKDSLELLNAIEKSNITTNVPPHVNCIVFVANEAVFQLDKTMKTVESLFFLIKNELQKKGDGTYAIDDIFYIGKTFMEMKDKLKTKKHFLSLSDNNATEKGKQYHLITCLFKYNYQFNQDITKLSKLGEFNVILDDLISDLTYSQIYEFFDFVYKQKLFTLNIKYLKSQFNSSQRAKDLILLNKDLILLNKKQIDMDNILQRVVQITLQDLELQKPNFDKMRNKGGNVSETKYTLNEKVANEDFTYELLQLKDSIKDDIEIIMSTIKNNSNSTFFKKFRSKGIILHGVCFIIWVFFIFFHHYLIDCTQLYLSIARGIANDYEFNFFAKKPTDFSSEFYGKSSKNISDFYNNTVLQNTPAIVFFDEFESIAASRGADNSHEETNKSVNALLVNLETFENNDDKIIFHIAATNFVEKLDPAVRRRFTNHIYVGLPYVHLLYNFFMRQIEGMIMGYLEENNVSSKLFDKFYTNHDEKKTFKLIDDFSYEDYIYTEEEECYTIYKHYVKEIQEEKEKNNNNNIKVPETIANFISQREKEKEILEAQIKQDKENKQKESTKQNEMTDVDDETVTTSKKQTEPTKKKSKSTWKKISLLTNIKSQNLDNITVFKKEIEGKNFTINDLGRVMGDVVSADFEDWKKEDPEKYENLTAWGLSANERINYNVVKQKITTLYEALLVKVKDKLKDAEITSDMETMYRFLKMPPLNKTKTK